jgi:nicotinate-nucleotide adenylyltransferase
LSALGVFGGTFDPVHLGHLAAARDCAAGLGLSRVLLVPSGRPPHRPGPEAGAADRLAMAELAAGTVPGLVADGIEARRDGPSYAIDTLEALRRREGDREIVLLLGQDAAAEFGSWHRATEIPGLAGIAVFNRAGSPAPDLDALTAAGMPAATRLVEVRSPMVSATEVRRRLRAGEDVSEMLPASVLEYIATHGLYGCRV